MANRTKKTDAQVKADLSNIREDLVDELRTRLRNFEESVAILNPDWLAT